MGCLGVGRLAAGVAGFGGLAVSDGGLGAFFGVFAMLLDWRAVCNL